MKASKYYHTIVIGTGCAGYSAADRLYGLGVKNIAIVTEGRLKGTSRNTGSDKQTYYKLSLCGAEGDSVRELADTLYAGGGVMGEHALAEAAYSTRCFMRLVELGVPFPANEFGEYAGYKTDHDPRTRATSAGPLTSKYMTEALERSVLDKGIPVLDGLLAIKILTGADGVNGLACVDVNSGKPAVFACRNVILCTGGPAGIYKNTVYPESQHGSTGLAIDAGAALSNMEEWQYGIASTAFRWNLSGTYQQVLPRYISVDPDGREREFLYDALGSKAPDLVFLKGYQWPFDTRKTAGSSQVDLLVASELKRGNRVYLDFTANPKGLDDRFEALGSEAYDYLKRSGALFGTPIERLAKMNSGAIELYAAHGIDLWHEPLEIAVCAQHCNGGVCVDADWQTSVRGLFAAGEAAGTFGVYRPGGSALNSTQVGSLRAAERIAREAQSDLSEQNAPNEMPEYCLPNDISYGEPNAAELLENLRADMSRYADFDRDTAGMKALFERVDGLCRNFAAAVTVRGPEDAAAYFRLYDSAVTARAALSAMICSAEAIGTHGSAFVDRQPGTVTEARTTRTLTVQEKGRVRSFISPVSAMPDPELWFETLLERQRQAMNSRRGTPQ